MTTAGAGSGSSLNPGIQLLPASERSIGLANAFDPGPIVGPMPAALTATGTSRQPRTTILFGAGQGQAAGSITAGKALLAPAPPRAIATGVVLAGRTQIQPNAALTTPASGAALGVKLAALGAAPRAQAIGAAFQPRGGSTFLGVTLPTAAITTYGVNALFGAAPGRPAASVTAYAPGAVMARSGTTQGAAVGTATNPTALAYDGNAVPTEALTAAETVTPALTGVFLTGNDKPHILLHHPDYEGWAVEQMVSRHDGALWRFGEYSMFVLLWDIHDYHAGLVGRCQECQTPHGAIAEVYKSPMKTRCLTCLGTTFQGGYKAKIVRPAMWDMSEEVHNGGEHGELVRQTASLQSTNDFRMRTGDFVLRADSSRWHVESLSTNHLRTGFGFPGKAETVIGFNYGNLVLADPTSNASAIQVQDDLGHILNSFNPRVGLSFAQFEEIRGPLLPPSPAIAP